MSADKLSKEELEKINEFADSSKAYDTLRKLSTCRFAVGDIVIKQEQDYNDRWSDINISYACPAARKYKIVHVDKFGVPWTKVIDHNTGKLKGKAVSIVSSAKCKFTRFVPDKEYAESILLGKQYDPTQAAKEAVDKCKRLIEHNKKIGWRPTSVADVKKKFKTFKKGDTFWLYANLWKYIMWALQDEEGLSCLKRKFIKIQRNGYIKYNTWDNDSGSWDPYVCEIHTSSLYSSDSDKDVATVWTEEPECYETFKK